MPFSISGKIEGLESVLAALDNVDKKVRRKGVRKAASAAGKIVLKAAKGKARKKSGLLKKSLGRKVKVYRATGVAIAVVGPRAGFRQEVQRDGQTVLSNPVKYAHLVELGTARSMAYPFLRPALEDNRSAITAAMAAAIREAVEGVSK